MRFLRTGLFVGVLAAVVLGKAIWPIRAMLAPVRPNGTSPSIQPDPALEEQQPLGLAGETMGGTWSVKLPRLQLGSSEELRQKIQLRLDHLDAQMSIYRSESDVSHFNRYQGTDWFNVPRELEEVVAESQQVSLQTDGTFDITVEPLVNLWGFGPDRTGLRLRAMPSDKAIAAARSRVDYHRLECRPSPPSLRKNRPDICIDLGAIAKGYAAGAVAADLDALNIADYLVAVGGELRAKGASTHGKPWRVGIETPTPDLRRILARIDLRDASLSTSGDYRNFFDVGGKRFCHEIDPRTGRPIENGPASVSVVDRSGSHADAMATALMVLGPEKGLALASRMHLAAMFIIRGDGHFEKKATPEFERMVVP